MKSPFKKERKLITDFYMWMVENDYDHNIRIRVENKAELFLREQEQVNGTEKSDSNCNLQNVIASGKAERIKHFMIGAAASLTCAEHYQRVEIAETLFEKLKETNALSDSFHLL